MARLTVTKDPGYAASVNIDGRVIDGAVSLDGETLKVGDQTFTIGAMRLIAETKEDVRATPQPAADHPAMAAQSNAAPAPAATTTDAATAGLGVTDAGGGAIPARDGGNAPSTRSR